MIPVSTLAGKTVAVVGLGGSGLPTAHALHAAEATIVGWDDGEAAREKAIAAGVRVENLEDADWGQFDALVLSPGIPLTHPAPHWSVQRARAAGVPITGDVDSVLSGARGAVSAGTRLGDHRYQRQIDDHGAGGPCHAGDGG
jgi:UDP-N-acetylmuramoylalanine--D-glutamate ligase